MMVSPSAASRFLSCDRNLLVVFESSKMAHYGFVFPTKSFSLLPKCKIRYFNFYMNLPVILESTDISFSELWLSLKHQSCSIKKTLYCWWLLPTAVCSYLKAVQLKCVEQQGLSCLVCACPDELQLGSSTLSLKVFNTVLQVLRYRNGLSGRFFVCASIQVMLKVDGVKVTQ